MAARIVFLRGMIGNKSVCGLRNIHVTTPALVEQDWRYSRGLPRNSNASGPLTDNRDFSFVDGTPSPLGKGQKRRLILNQLHAEKILQTVKEMDFAVERFQRITKEKEESRQSILQSKLKVKGHRMLNKLKKESV